MPIPTLPATPSETELAQKTRDMQLLLGRVLIGGAFLFSGGAKLFNMDAYLALIPDLTQASLWISLTAALELVAGCAIVAGFQLRFAALALFLWFIPVTFIVHPPTDPTQVLHFTKNLIILGGFQLLMICGPGRYSLDHYLGEDK